MMLMFCKLMWFWSWSQCDTLTTNTPVWRFFYLIDQSQRDSLKLLFVTTFPLQRFEAPVVHLLLTVMDAEGGWGEKIMY